MSTKRKKTDAHKEVISGRREGRRSAHCIAIFEDFEKEEKTRRLRRGMKNCLRRGLLGLVDGPMQQTCMAYDPARCSTASLKEQIRWLQDWEYEDFVRAQAVSPAMCYLMIKRIMCGNLGCKDAPIKFCEVSGQGYCSVSCQHASWSLHKDTVRRVRKNICAYKNADEVDGDLMRELGGKEEVQNIIDKMARI